MPGVQHKVPKLNHSQLQVAGILMLLFLAVLLLLFNHLNSSQATSAMAAQVRFEGEYRIGDGSWQEITEGQHIPATKGDVTLRGNFHMLTPDGEYVGIYSGDLPIAFYTNHIGITIYEEGLEPYQFDAENPLYGDAVCSVSWTAHLFAVGQEDPIEIVIHNPHRFGNETAIDEMLSSLALWTGIEFEKSILTDGQTQRNTGLFFVIIAFVLLGSALFSALLHVPNSRIIWLLGATVLSAGVYLAYNASGTYFWSEYTDVNTSMLGFSMMFYLLFVSGIITYFLKNTKKISYITTVGLGVFNGLYLVLPVLTDVRFYDTWLPWVITQSVANGVLLFCLIKEYISAEKKERWGHVGMALLLIAFEEIGRAHV